MHYKPRMSTEVAIICTCSSTDGDCADGLWPQCESAAAQSGKPAILFCVAICSRGRKNAGGVSQGPQARVFPIQVCPLHQKQLHQGRSRTQTVDIKTVTVMVVAPVVPRCHWYGCSLPPANGGTLPLVQC